MNFLNALFARVAALIPAKVGEKIGADKVLHFAGGVVFGSVGCVLALLLGGHAWWALALAAAAGFAKEGLDLLQNRQAAAAGLPASHTVDFLDAIWTTVGGTVPALVFVVCTKLSTGVPALDPMLKVLG